MGNQLRGGAGEVLELAPKGREVEVLGHQRGSPRVTHLRGGGQYHTKERGGGVLKAGHLEKQCYQGLHELDNLGILPYYIHTETVSSAFHL